MTTIAARKDKTGKVQVAWDSQSTGGHTASLFTNKVVMVNEQFAVGVGGRVRYSNMVLRASIDKIHAYDITQPTFDAMGWLIEVLVPTWQKAVSKGWDLTPKDADDQIPWGVGLIALAGGIYEVGSDFSVLDLGEFGAIGSGEEFATAAMFLGKTAKQAVKVASELDLYTGGTVKGVLV